MELEEAVKFLEEYLDKEDRKFVSEYRLMFLKSIETLINYIKEESIPKAVVEDKFKELKKVVTDYPETNEEIGERAQLKILQEILNKGEK